MDRLRDHADTFGNRHKLEPGIMIRQLANNRRRGLVPRDVFNSIVAWIRGVQSPSGTLHIKNTLSPSENGSIEIDVDLEHVYQYLRERIAKDFATHEDVSAALSEKLDAFISAYQNRN